MVSGRDLADARPVDRRVGGLAQVIGRLGGTGGVWLLAAALAAASGAVFLALVLPMPAYDEIELPWLFFAVAFGLAEVGALHLSVRSQAVTVSLAEIPLVVGFYFAAPADLVLAQLAGTAIALVAVRRQSPLKLAFNLSLSSLTTSLAVVVFRAVAPSTGEDMLLWWAASLAGSATAALVSAPVIAAAMSISRRGEPRALRTRLVVGLVAATVNSSLALVAVEVLRTRPQLLWPAVIPSIVMILGYRAYANQRERQARLEFLHECARILQRPFLEEATLTQLLRRTRVMFHADVAEVVVFADAERPHPTRAVVGPGDAVEAPSTVDEQLAAGRLGLLSWAGDGALIRRPGQDRATADLLAAAGLTDAIVVPLLGDRGVVGTLLVANRDAHRGAFTREDLRLLETLGVQAGAALQSSSLVSRLAETLANVTQLAAAIQSSDDAIMALAPDGTIVAWNPAAEVLFGYPAAEIAGMPARVLVGPDRRDEVAERFGGATAGGPVRQGSTEIVRRDGTRVPVSATLSPIVDSEGSVRGLAAIVRDETERTRAEAALRASEEQFRSVFQDGPIGMAMAGDDLRWAAVNDALCRMLERRPEELIGQGLEHSVHPDDVAAALRQTTELLASPGGGGYSVKRRYVSASGRTVWARVTARPLWDAAAGSGRAICIIEDVTESHLAADRVRDTEARLHRAVAAFTAVREPASVLQAVLEAARDLLDADFAAIAVLSDDGATIVDIKFDGIDEASAHAIGRIPEGMGLLGLVRRATTPMRISDVAAHPAAAGFPAGHPVIASFLSVPIVFEERLLAHIYVGNKRSNAEFDAEDEVVAAALASQAAVVLENARITSRALALIDELDRANARLRQANDAKSEFLGTVSHELRTPLHSILVAAELVHDPVFGPLSDERVRELGATIQESGRHLLGLIDDLVDLSRIEADRIDLRRAEIAVGQLLREVHHEIAPLAGARGLSIEVSGDLGARIHADPLRIRQVLVNLLANAVKFTKSGGRISIDVHRSARSIEIAVSDTGIGIAPGDLERVFEPFERGTGASSPGAGLGLAIARRLVELHGGSLDVSSASGVGSTFTVALPRAVDAGRPPAAGPPVLDEQLTFDPAPRTILAVEDDPTALRLVADLLRRSRFVVEEARGIAEAKERLHAAVPSLILLDTRLGGEDGLDLARWARVTPAVRDVPILALSADAMQHDVERARDAGCDGHLAKPVVARELLARIRELTAPGPAPAETGAGSV